MKLHLAIMAAALVAPLTSTDTIFLFIHHGAVRAVLLDTPVIEHLHVDLPERQPLLLSTRFLIADEDALNLPFDIEYVEVGSDKERDSFQFTTSTRDEAQNLIVTYAFPPEGITGRYTLQLRSTGWTVIDRELIEH